MHLERVASLRLHPARLSANAYLSRFHFKSLRRSNNLWPKIILMHVPMLNQSQLINSISIHICAHES